MLLSWDYLLWHLIGLCWIILLVCNFWKVHFTAVIMPDFFLLVEPNIFEVIFGKCFWLFFVESCLLAALSTESNRGQRKAMLLPEPKLPTDR
jgi:hypothetical protein